MSILILVFVEVSLDEALRDPHGKDVPHDIGHREAACGPQALYRQAAAANKAHSVKKHKFGLEIKPVQQFIFNSLCSTSLPIFEQFLNMFRSATMQGVSS